MYISDFNNGLMREPAILTTFTRDIYLSPLGYEEGGDDGHNHDGSVLQLEKGGSTVWNGVTLTFKEFDISAETMQAMQQGQDFEMGAVLTAEKDGVQKEFELKRKSIGGKLEFTSESFKDLNLKVELLNLQAGKIDIALSSLDGSGIKTIEEKKEVLSVSASIKPFINFVWIGVAVMVIGFFVSMVRRLPESFIKR
jgi:cytochrome c biogenesis factor